MGPIAAKSYPGQQAIHLAARPAERATQEIDYGRRGKGYAFGALRPATGDVYLQTYAGRTIANWIDFLSWVDAQLPVDSERVIMILDNLNVHHSGDVLLFLLRHPRWEFQFQPVYAAYLNLIEPWWKVVHALALKGRRFETWDEVQEAIAQAQQYWQAHKHPFVWGRRRRHRHPVSKQPFISPQLKAV
jgi:hypothetical protein